MSILKLAASRVFPGRFVIKGPARARNAIALTFDDGPHPSNTPALLDEFDRAGIKVTFFLIGREVQKHPGITRRIIDAGHQIANHGFAHLNARKVAPGAYLADIEQGHDALEQVAGRRIQRVTRPPYGTLTPATLTGMLLRGHRIVLWSFDSLDYSVRSADMLAERIRTHAFRPGEIVLAHDDYSHTVEAMPRLVASLRDRGHVFRTVSELLPGKRVGADA